MGQLITINVCEVKTMIKRQLRPADAFHFDTVCFKKSNSSNSTADFGAALSS